MRTPFSVPMSPLIRFGLHTLKAILSSRSTPERNNYHQNRGKRLCTQTVTNLQVTFTFSVGTARGQESAPIVVAIRYNIVSSFPNVLYAFDLEKPGAPVKWRFEPKPEASAQGEACCEGVNRGSTVSDGRVFFVTSDDQAVAVDAQSGQKFWQVRLGD
jgi:glucose dehydrogenase